VSHIAGDLPAGLPKLEPREPTNPILSPIARLPAVAPHL